MVCSHGHSTEAYLGSIHFCILIEGQVETLHDFVVDLDGGEGLQSEFILLEVVGYVWGCIARFLWCLLECHELNLILLGQDLLCIKMIHSLLETLDGLQDRLGIGVARVDGRVDATDMWEVFIDDAVYLLFVGIDELRRTYFGLPDDVLEFEGFELLLGVVEWLITFLNLLSDLLCVLFWCHLKINYFVLCLELIFF